MSGLTRQDKEFYLSTIIERPYTYSERLESWDLTTSLFIYINNEYKEYSGYHLDMILLSVSLAYKYKSKMGNNPKSTSISRKGQQIAGMYTPKVFKYYEKGDVLRSFPYRTNEEDLSKLYGMCMGDERLLDFVTYYIKDLTLRCLDGMFYLKKLTKYEEYIKNRLIELCLFIKTGEVYQNIIKENVKIKETFKEVVSETIEEERQSGNGYTERQLNKTSFYVRNWIDV